MARGTDAIDVMATLRMVVIMDSDLELENALELVF
jgi:hypothetical protein